MARRIVITYVNGTVEKISCGDSNKTLSYEVEGINNSILNLNKANSLTSLNISKDVMSIMDEIRRQWGISYGKLNEF